MTSKFISPARSLLWTLNSYICLLDCFSLTATSNLTQPPWAPETLLSLPNLLRHNLPHLSKRQFPLPLAEVREPGVILICLVHRSKSCQPTFQTQSEDAHVSPFSVFLSYHHFVPGLLSWTLNWSPCFCPCASYYFTHLCKPSNGFWPHLWYHLTSFNHQVPSPLPHSLLVVHWS